MYGALEGPHHPGVVWRRVLACHHDVAARDDHVAPEGAELGGPEEGKGPRRVRRLVPVPGEVGHVGRVDDVVELVGREGAARVELDEVVDDELFELRLGRGVACHERAQALGVLLPRIRAQQHGRAIVVDVVARVHTCADVEVRVT